MKMLRPLMMEAHMCDEAEMEAFATCFSRVNDPSQPPPGVCTIIGNSLQQILLNRILRLYTLITTKVVGQGNVPTVVLKTCSLVPDMPLAWFRLVRFNLLSSRLTLAGFWSRVWCLIV